MVYTAEIEQERKFLINDIHHLWQMVDHLFSARTLGKYALDNGVCKSRAYRYFDTFTGDLQKADDDIQFYASAESKLPLFERRYFDEHDRLLPGILENFGASVSARERGELADCVLTVKIPTGAPNERGDYNYPLPKGTNLFEIDPNAFDYWEQFKQIKEIVGNFPLQEVVRLYVQTHRVNLYEGRRIKRNKKAEVALDVIVAIYSNARQELFCELEIERKGNGDIDAIAELLCDIYGGCLTESPFPKWIKAMKLFRGERIDGEINGR
jgi:hypothetical protein